MNTKELIERDLVLYGRAFTVGGKHVPVEEVVVHIAPQNSVREAIAEVHKNEAGQLSLRKPDGSFFDISEHVGAKLYKE